MACAEGVAPSAEVFDHRKTERLYHQAVRALIESLYRDGVLTPEDFGDRKRLHGTLRDVLEHSAFDHTVDYRDFLAKLAREFSSDQYLEVALLFYALVYEHTINKIVYTVLGKRNMARKAIDELVRRTDCESKFTWLLDILQLPRLNDKHRRIIIEVMSKRNCFVHYKYTPRPDAPSDMQKETDHLRDLARRADGAAKYLKWYESRVFFSGKKHLLKGI